MRPLGYAGFRNKIWPAMWLSLSAPYGTGHLGYVCAYAHACLDRYPYLDVRSADVYHTVATLDHVVNMLLLIWPIRGWLKLFELESIVHGQVRCLPRTRSQNIRLHSGPLLVSCFLFLHRPVWPSTPFWASLGPYWFLPFCHSFWASPGLT